MKSIQVNLVFFGSLKSIFGEQISISVTNGTEVSSIVDDLKKRKPESLEILNVCQVAVNSELESLDFVITKSSEIAFLPPFSGG
jgi:molybdopterin converting factor small subunit